MIDGYVLYVWIFMKKQLRHHAVIIFFVKNVLRKLLLAHFVILGLMDNLNLIFLLEDWLMSSQLVALTSIVRMSSEKVK